MEKQTLYTVGELAKKMAVTVRTLQYYDKEGLLKPSAFSEGGRRLYSDKDMIQLHQILSFKYLGLSLEQIKQMLLSMDTPEEVAAILKQQHEIIAAKIADLNAALHATDALHEEVKQIGVVDFSKYADIIALLKMENKDYWVIKALDKKLTTHLHNRFADQPAHALGVQIMQTYQAVLEEAVQLKRRNEPPDSKKSMALAKKWWDMVLEFTGGDMSLLPSLLAFNDDKTKWNLQTAEKQKEADDYIGAALYLYFQKTGISVPEMEGEHADGNQG